MGHIGVSLISEPTCKASGLASALSLCVISGRSSAPPGSVSPSVKTLSFYTSSHVMNEATPRPVLPPALPFLVSAAAWGAFLLLAMMLSQPHSSAYHIVGAQ